MSFPPVTSGAVARPHPVHGFEEHVWPGHSGPLHVRLYRGAAQRRSDVLLVLFHPGGFVSADLDGADACMKVLAETCRVNVLAATYALAPAHPFPAAVEDAHAVLQLAVKQRFKLGWWGTHLFVGGVEAGGNLAAVSALVCRDRGGPKLAGQILVMPMLDASLHCNSMLCAADCPNQQAVAQALEHGYRSYLPNPADRAHPYASPLLATRLAGLPPALVVHAEGDPLSDEARAYADKLEAAGVPVQRAALPLHERYDDGERCAATADDPAVTALARFLAPYADPATTPPMQDASACAAQEDPNISSINSSIHTKRKPS